MEPTYAMTFDGQAVLKQDVDLIASTAGHVDDHILAELLRLTPYSGSAVSKAILPFGHQTSADTLMVTPSGSPAYSVLVQPFRAVLGARSNTAINDENGNQIAPGTVVAQQDYRSIVCPGGTVTFAAATNPRWDLVYAAITPDVQPYSLTRKVKDLTSAVITARNVFPWSTTTCTLGVVTGGTLPPAFPSAPADAGGVYYIPIANVLLPAGYPGVGSQINAGEIVIVAPVAGISGAVGGQGLTIASSLNVGIPVATQNAWTGTTPCYVPSTAGGGDSLFVAVDLRTATISHADGAVVDARDWRGRVCKWQAMYFNAPFAWEASSGVVPDPSNASETKLFGMGQTLTSSSQRTAVDLAAGGITFQLYADNTTGQLKVHYSGGPNVAVVCWIDFTRPIA